MKEKRMVPIQYNEGYPLIVLTPGRNEPCACKSGKKTKRCCGVKKEFFREHKYSVKLKLEQQRKEQERIDKLRHEKAVEKAQTKKNIVIVTNEAENSVHEKVVKVSAT